MLTWKKSWRLAVAAIFVDKPPSDVDVPVQARRALLVSGSLSSSSTKSVKGRAVAVSSSAVADTFVAESVDTTRRFVATAPAAAKQSATGPVPASSLPSSHPAAPPL
jgi:hypothetical protein